MRRNATLLAMLLAVTSLLGLEPAAIAAVQLQSVVGGLSSPVYLTNADDGSNRLFIVEQPGRIKVLQPEATVPTVFLDITARVLFGGEQGLLGLAFHPQFSANRRFFVNYTRQTDGATVIAEYHASASDPDIADTAETPLLTIAQPFSNHNGGMIAFGPDGYLYIGMGDGGSGNDPGNRAQNIGDLLGKMLRIDVDHPDGAVPYSSPPTNPFFGLTPGRDEIYAVGLRNPWRFSFDRGTGQLFCGDVGQAAREEVDIITLGGNFGWRVFEGTLCTNNDPALCATLQSVAPIAEYDHSSGRCAITGGYVYRGPIGTLPTGAYVYADFCTGEIFVRSGGSSSLLLDTALNISSFGEDEAGEIYVVGLGGTVDRMVNPDTACAFGINPTSQFFEAAGGTGSVLVTTVSGCAWTASTNSGSSDWIGISSGLSGNGNGTVNYFVLANDTGSTRTGTLAIAGMTFTITQQGGGCSYSISPASASFGPGAGTGVVNVTAGAGCPWTASTNSGSSDWLGISSGFSGTGNGTVEWYAFSNDGTSSRSGYLTIAGQTFTVTQSGVGPDLTGAWTTPLTQTCRAIGKVQRCSLKGTFTVSNIGNRDASSTPVKLYLSDNATFEGGDTQLKSVATGRLKPGKGKAIHVNLILATNQTATGKYIISVIDKDNSVTEIDEGNNIITYGPIP